MLKNLFSFSIVLSVVSCGDNQEKTVAPGDSTTVVTGSVAYRDTTTLPPPFATESVKNFSKVIGWKEGQMPMAPGGFTVSKFADKLANPRWVYVAPNGDIFVAESATVVKGAKKLEAEISGKAASQNMGSSANRITRFRDADKNGVPETRHVYLTSLNQPFGMLVLNDKFYVACTDGLWQYPYNPGDSNLRSPGKKILELPAGGYNNHWTRNVIANKEGNLLYISVGSGSNVAENGLENEIRRANILEVKPDGSGERVFAGGLRNPVGMDWAPGTNTLWTAVNERDGLGDSLVPDYITSVKDGAFYGWPFAYFGPNEDPRMKDKQNHELVKKTIKPDLPLGSHTASLGLIFYDKNVFPSRYQNGAFVSQHGSWNSSKLTGYKVVFIPFANGKPSGPPEDFLTGFIAEPGSNDVYGRPVGLAVPDDGSLLVTDDAANTIWRVAAKQ
ncbi:MAG: sorbosone dehydrogenase family protein [Chitinophagaceae bacterium]|nr:MAG: sorbosone dehydrogenase family protein [Chitinophagaceae bacterium]